MLKELQEGESLPLVMIGDPAYYDRFFDFSPGPDAGVDFAWTVGTRSAAGPGP